MAVDPFSLILTNVASSIIGWGVNRVLDTVANCICGNSQNRNVSNSGFNALYCPSCSRSLEQYTNATAHTVNPNLSIATVAISGIQWPNWRNKFTVYYDLDTVNSRYQDFVVEVVFSQFRGAEFARFTEHYKPIHERHWWRGSSFWLSGSQFPRGQYTFAMDFNIYNLWGEPLCRTRALGDFSGE